MKKRHIKIIVFLCAVLCFIGIVGLIGTSINNKIINSIDREFCYCEKENGEIELRLPDNGTVSLSFNNKAVKIKDSSKINDRRSILYIILFINSYAKDNDYGIERTTVDLIGEYRLHTHLYNIGYNTASTKDADLDYEKDERWYVRIASKIIGWLGI